MTTKRVQRAWPLVGLGLAVVLGWAVWHVDAASQIQVGPAYTPIGVASSGNGSAAWFHHPASGRVVACLAAPGAAGVQCAEGRLP